MSIFRKGKMYQIELAEIQANPQPPRKTTDHTAMAELAASIGKLGVIAPILFQVDSQANKVVIAGERRVEAARQAGLSAIPGIFIAANHAEIALAENLLRQDLTPIEEAEGLQALMNQQQYTQVELGAIIGKSQASLCESLSLVNLPQEVRDDARGDRALGKTTLVAIAKKKQPEQMIKAYQAYKAKLNKTKTSPKRAPNQPQIVQAFIDKTVARINALDTSAWSDEDKSSFHTSLASLKTEIDLHLNGSAPA